MISQYTILDETRDFVVKQLKMYTLSPDWNYELWLIALGKVDVLNFIAEKNGFWYFLYATDLFTDKQKIILELYDDENRFGEPITRYLIAGDKDE